MQQLIEIIEQKSEAATAEFQSCKLALEETLPQQRSQSQRAVDAAQQKLTDSLISACLAGNQISDVSAEKLSLKMAAHREIIQTLPQVAEILNERKRAAQKRIRQAGDLLRRYEYLTLRDQVVSAGKVIDKETRSELVHLGGVYSGREGHRLADALKEHEDMNRRTKKETAFSFNPDGDSDSWDSLQKACEQA